MGYRLTEDGMNAVLKEWSNDYIIYAPKIFIGGGAFSDTDSIRYGQIEYVNEIEFDKKSNVSMKEVLLPITQQLFYFTEDSVREPEPPKKGAILFLRSCDLHGIKRLDEIYLNNGPQDHYYKRLRDGVKFILMGCKSAYENCFCVDMGTNKSELYDAGIDCIDGEYLVDCKLSCWNELLAKESIAKLNVTPMHVTGTATHVRIPNNLTAAVSSASMWEEYDTRCINCGRCNFVCPTCTCFTMQDIYYDENCKVGERRRVWASCMVDGFTDVAGGASYRKKNGQRMRFKVLHKVLDYKQRFGYHMCVGCGRCDDVCPEYISFSNCITKLGNAILEVNNSDEK